MLKLMNSQNDEIQGMTMTINIGKTKMIVNKRDDYNNTEIETQMFDSEKGNNIRICRYHGDRR